MREQELAVITGDMMDILEVVQKIMMMSRELESGIRNGEGLNTLSNKRVHLVK